MVTSRIRAAAACLLSAVLFAQLAACSSSQSFGGAGGTGAVGGTGSGSNGGSGTGGGGSGGGSSGSGAGGGSGSGSSGSGGNTGTAASYTVSVSLSGLSEGDTIVLALNGTYLLTVHWAAPYNTLVAFPDRSGQPLMLPAHTRFVLAVSTPPAHKTCSASPSTGEATGPVFLSVDCSLLASGSAQGVNGAQDTAALATDAADGRLAGMAEAAGPDGSRWRFGGRRAGASLDLSDDLWVLGQGASSWLRASGEGGTNVPGRYPAPGNTSPTAGPGGRAAARLWVAADGTVWLFGGAGIDADGTYGELLDLWQFDPGTRQWTWAGGEAAVARAARQRPQSP